MIRLLALEINWGKNNDQIECAFFNYFYGCTCWFSKWINKSQRLFHTNCMKQVDKHATQMQKYFHLKISCFLEILMTVWSFEQPSGAQQTRLWIMNWQVVCVGVRSAYNIWPSINKLMACLQLRPGQNWSARYEKKIYISFSCRYSKGCYDKALLIITQK